MRRLSSISSLFALAALGLAACGGTSPPTAQAACQNQQTAFYQRAAQCLGFPTDEATTFASAPSTAYYCQQLAGAAMASKVTYDSGKESQCEQDIAALNCNALLNGTLPASCMAVFVGKATTGGACASSAECASNSCNQSDSMGNFKCPGMCQATVAAGGDCSMGQACASGLNCVTNAAGTASMCTAPAMAGGDCTNNSCAAGLYCDSTTMKCVAVKTSGPCPTGNECDATTVCVGASGSGTCQAPKHVGDACTAGMSQCALGLYCASGKCAEWSKIGGPCGNLSGENAGCQEGYCSIVGTAMTGTCTAPGKAGAPCNVFNFGGDCTPGNFCNPTPGSMTGAGTCASMGACY